MQNRGISKKKIFFVSLISIMFSMVVAIIVHAMMPAAVNVEDFDSLLVMLLGFPIVALLYFGLLYTHCVVMTRHIGKQSIISNLQIGIRFGLAFSLIYFFGMQEVVIEASPFNEWGYEFVKYQFFMGLGDALPALLLCIIVACFTIDKKSMIIDYKVMNLSGKMKSIILISVIFLIARTIGYETGLIKSNCNTFPIPCYVWTLTFGIILGIAYVLIYPIFHNSKFNKFLSFKLVALTIGINWIIFNSFIGLIFKGVMIQMLVRSGIDIVVLFLCSMLITKYFIEPEIISIRKRDTTSKSYEQDVT